MTVRTLRLPALVWVVALSGCSLVLKPPTMRVAEVQAASLGLTGGTVRLHLELENPNGFSVSAESFAYRFDIGEDADTDSGETVWTNIFDGVYPDVVELPAKGRTTVEVEVPLRYASVGTVVGRLLRQGEVEYRFSGLFRFHFVVGGVNVPFDEQGTFRP